jgi:hypothetical protein
MERLMFYLWMPAPYLHLLNGLTQGKSGELRWAAGGDAIEGADGTTFLFSPQLASFLEGFARVRSLIHFGHVLHLLYYLVKKDKDHPEPFRELHAAFRRTGRGLDNAGALCAYLCSEIPPVPGPLHPRELVRFLYSPARMAEFVARPPGLSERAPLLPEAFEEKFCRALRTMPYSELAHWLRHGRGSLTQPAEQIARELDPARPRTLAGVLAALAQRQRFAGAIPYVGQLVSALALPPRRLARQELPTGGYADVGTHGHPEQILPSQFALDDLEFLRRFADHELLYFRREEPHRQTREDLVLLLDQGVRTWGDVRLVLGAAVLAFGKNAARRNMPLRLAATSGGGTLVDPLQADDAALGELLEASDLSPHPGLTLEQVLAEKAEAGRDIVLLTHPRSLAEPDVTAAARRLQPGMRLFAVTVAETGAVELAEIRHGTPVKLGQFQVDLSLGHQVKHRPQAPAPAVPPEPLAPWTGNPEPIPFPFRFGPQGRIDKIAFDCDGDWVVLGDQKGMLYAFRIDGTQSEVLPRVLVNSGAFLQRIDALLGVAGGVVAAGRIGDLLLVVHYDFSQRQCRPYVVGNTAAMFLAGPPLAWQWFYFREFHAVVATPQGLVAAPSASFARGVDLGSGEKLVPHSAYRSRVADAYWEAKKYILPPPYLPVARDTNFMLGQHRTLRHDETTGTIHVENMEAAWEPVTPLAAGQPIFRDVVLDQAVCQRNLLAITSGSPGYASRTLHLLQMPNGVPLGEYQLGEFFHCFALSGDGKLLARQTSQSRVEVREVSDLAHRRLLTTSGKFHPDCTVILGRDWLAVQVGNFRHILDWRSGELVITEDRFGKQDSLQSLEIARRNLFLKAEARYLPASVHYDPQRFLAAATFDLTVVVDAYGQLTLFAGSRLFCVFFIFRHQVAGWTPDGIRFGPASMSQGPETPGALQKIGRALKEAAAALSGQTAREALVKKGT